MVKFALIAAIFLLLCSPAFAAEPVWKWPFEQNKKEVGVDFVPRKVHVKDGEVRTWHKIPFDLRKADVEGKVVELREDMIVLLVAGSSKPIDLYKNAISPLDRLYVRNLEIALAKELEEPGAEDLEEITAAQDEAERRMAYEELRASKKTIPAQAPVAPENLRTWTDRLGKNSIRAAFVKVLSPLQIEVLTAEGKKVKLNINGLSKSDREYVAGLEKEE